MKTLIAEVRNERLTIGLDLGDKSSAYCVLDESGSVVSEHRVGTKPKALSDCYSGMRLWRLPSTGMQSEAAEQVAAPAESSNTQLAARTHQALTECG